MEEKCLTKVFERNQGELHLNWLTLYLIIIKRLDLFQVIANEVEFFNVF